MHLATSGTPLGSLVVGLGVAVMLTVAACGSSDGDDAGATTTAPPATEAPSSTAAPTTGSPEPTTTAPAPTTTAAPGTTTSPTAPGGGPGSGPDLDAALALFRDLRATACTMAPTPEPVKATETEGVVADKAIIIDAEDNRLVLDIPSRTVYAFDGPQSVLPPAYSFGCDPEVFLGSLDH